MLVDIAEVSRRSGLPASTLRFYEQKGIISSVGRHGIRRRFGPEIFERLSLISLGRLAGFSLDEIASMFAADGGPRIDRGQLRAQADLLDGKIRRLVAVRDGLRHAAACPAADHRQCPKFRRLMRAAGLSHARMRGRRPADEISASSPRRPR